MRTAIVVLWAILVSAAALAADPDRRWHGNYFPNVVLKTHEGKSVRFYDDVIRGKVVAINFIYTSCGDVCPLDTAQLREVQKRLGNRVGKDIFMYSISIDPKRDTPAALARYMHTFDVGPGWTFLTGKREDVDLLQRKLGIRPIVLNKFTEHDTRLIMGNEKTGSWIKRSPYDDPQILANLLSSAMTNYVNESKGVAPYPGAQEIKDVSHGRYLFRTRCDACHTIGGGDRLGPDLAGVTQQRDAAWLGRWLKEPDKMLAEGDAIAVALKARFRDLPMPNLGLGDIDVDALVEYMRAESERQSKAVDGGKQ